MPLPKTILPLPNTLLPLPNRPRQGQSARKLSCRSNCLPFQVIFERRKYLFNFTRLRVFKWGYKGWHKKVASHVSRCTLLTPTDSCPSRMLQKSWRGAFRTMQKLPKMRKNVYKLVLACFITAEKVKIRIQQKKPISRIEQSLSFENLQNTKQQ